jgi:hypothetical protein
LAIEKKYQAILSDQQGAGSVCKTCESKDSMPLSQIIMENEKQHSLQTPVPKIGPSISNPLEGAPDSHAIADEPNVTDSDSKKKDKEQKHEWFYIGDS